MKRTTTYIPIIFLLLFSLKVQGQTTTPKETVINQVYRNFIDSTFTYYYLMDDCPTLNYKTNEWNLIKKDLKNVVPDSVLEEIVSKSANDTLPLKWFEPALGNGTKCLNTEETNTLLGKQFSDTAKVTAKKQKSDIEESKKTWLAKPRKERTIYIFSRPVFDKSGQYALISMGWIQGNIGQTGWYTDSKTCTCLLENVRGNWKLMEKVNCTEQ